MADPKKSALAMMMGLGGGGAPPPEEEMAPPIDEMGGEMPPPEMESPIEVGGENLIALPKGFKAPDGVVDGEPFSTTVRGKIMNGQFQVEELGDMPLNGAAAIAESQPAEGEEESPELSQERDELAQRKSSEMEAKKVFQPGRMG